MPALTYYSGIPLAADDQDQSQPDILANFTAINSWTGVNHYNFASANAGKHSGIQLPEQGAAPTTAVNEGAVYTKVGAATAKTELAFRRENNGAVVETTASTLSTVPLAASNTPGWTMLPSGILMKWGYAAFGAAPTVDVLYDATVPFGAVFSVVITSTMGGGSNDHKVLISSSGDLHFTVKSTLNSNLTTNVGTAIYYFAVGRP